MARRLRRSRFQTARDHDKEAEGAAAPSGAGVMMRCCVAMGQPPQS